MVSLQSNALKEKVDYPGTVFIIAVAEDRLWHPAGKRVRSIPGKFRVPKTLRITGKIFRKCLRLERVRDVLSHNLTFVIQKNLPIFFVFLSKINPFMMLFKFRFRENVGHRSLAHLEHEMDDPDDYHPRGSIPMKSSSSTVMSWDGNPEYVPKGRAYYEVFVSSSIF